MKLLYSLQQLKRPRPSIQVFHTTFYILFNLIIVLEFSRAYPFSGGTDASKIVKPITEESDLVDTPISPSHSNKPIFTHDEDEGYKSSDAESFFHEDRPESTNNQKPRKEWEFPSFRTTSSDTDDETNPLLPKGEPSENPSSERLEGAQPHSLEAFAPVPPAHKPPRPNGKNWFIYIFSELWEWIKSKRSPREFPKLPIDHLKELTKGIWRWPAAFQYSPQSPVEKLEDELMVTIRMLGKELSPLNKEEFTAAVNTWKRKLEEKNAADLRVKVLSTELFLELSRQYYQETELAIKYQGFIKTMGENLAKSFGGENKLKELLGEIEDKFKEFNKGLNGLGYDPNFYVKPLSPLLLLTVLEDSAKFQNFLVEKGKLTGYFERSGISRMGYIVGEARKYHHYVQHFKKTTGIQSALKDYMDKQNKLNMVHQLQEEKILDLFQHLDQNRDSHLLDDPTQGPIDPAAMESIMRNSNFH